MVLGLAASACLGAPPDGSQPPLVDTGVDPSGPDAGAPPDGAAPDAAACPDAFAVAYTSRLDVRPAGGVFAGVLVIAAVGDAVDLSEMLDGADDSVQLELELSQPNYDPMAAGAVSGELDPAAAAFIMGPLVAPAAWTEPDTPTFQLTFSPVAGGSPAPHKATARLRIGGSEVALDFDLTYVTDQDEVAIPRAGDIAYSECGE